MESCPSIWTYIDDQFEIINKIGQGSFGVVMEAKHVKTGKIYAIKLISDVSFSAYETKKVCREI